MRVESIDDLRARKADRRSGAGEAHVEAVAFCDEAMDIAERVIDHLTGLPIPSIFAVNELGRLSMKAARARAEILRLSPEPAA